MKQKLLLLALLCCNFIYNAAKANETEPNNTKAQANTLALNGSNSGTISTTTDVDWFKVTTNADGQLTLTLTVSNGLNAWFDLYDNDGTTLLHETYTAGTGSYNVDGLATGTYYIKIFPYYSGQMPAYTISNTLTKPTQANDTEPDSTRAQALTLPLNGSVTGHIGYYYKNHRDTIDEYKVTTTADGALNVSLSVPNNTNVWFSLYDNDGKTLLHQTYTASDLSYTVDGLAKGTYYIQVFCYYNGQFAPYTLSNTLTKPAQASDTEPDSTLAQAEDLSPNKTATGHVGYYYNNHRDTLDVYKITTSGDGDLYLGLTVPNNTNVWFSLYDHDGKTLLHQTYTASNISYHVDGLAKGTYYLKINCYYSNQFAPYTITDTLYGYGAGDKEPNAYAKQASTLPARVASTGHVGFYYNNKRDTTDWQKINYTGANKGSMTITFKLLPHVSDNSIYNTYIQVYADTASAPIFNNYYTSATTNISLSNLTQGYYYVKIFEYYNNQSQAYSLTPLFSQNKIAKIVTADHSKLASCDTNHISYTISNTNLNSPSTVQLYRFGIKYGNAVVVPKGKSAVFDSLSSGVYYATVYADGATGTAYGKSDTVTLEPVPATLTTTGIAKNKVTLNWAAENCAKYFVINYKKQGVTSWTSKKTTGDVNTFNLTGLAANTTYTWRVATVDSANAQIVQSAFSDSAHFTTTASLMADDNNEEENISANKIANSILVSPNPATSFFVIHFSSDVQKKVNASVYDANGKAIWTSGLTDASALNNKQVNVSQFAKGIFYLKIINEQGELIGSTKIIIAK